MNKANKIIIGSGIPISQSSAPPPKPIPPCVDVGYSTVWQRESSIGMWAIGIGRPSRATAYFNSMALMESLRRLRKTAKRTFLHLDPDLLGMNRTDTLGASRRFTETSACGCASLTQASIAGMLGVRRSSVSTLANTLRRAGLIAGTLSSPEESVLEDLLTRRQQDSPLVVGTLPLLTYLPGPMLVDRQVVFI
jgi:Crp-like helix-turn-helix domain